MRQEEERLAAGAVAAQAGVDRAATGYGLDDLRLEAGRGQHAGDEPRRVELAVRGVGGGGLTDGMRIRSRSVATSSSDAPRQAAASSAPDGAASDVTAGRCRSRSRAPRRGRSRPAMRVTTIASRSRP